VISAAPPTPATMLATMRLDERRTRNGEPAANAMASARMGSINGAMSIAPMTTAVLPMTNPRVAMPTATRSCSQ